MKSHPNSLSRPTSPSQPSAQSIAERLRKLRLERGWSLADVERISKGSVKAVVLGSYERCDRTLSLNRAIQLANIFSIPLIHLLAAPEKSAPVLTRTTMMVDLRRARILAEGLVNQNDTIFQTLSAFLAWIAARRCDWNGEIMSLREGDLSTLSLMTFMNEEALLIWLKEKRLLVTELNRL